MLPQIIAALVALVILAAAMGVRALVLSRARSRIDQRLMEIRGGVITSDAPLIYIDEAPLPFPLSLVALLGWAMPHVATSDELQWDLARAGFRHPESRRVFSGVKLITTLAGLGIGFAVAVALRLPQVNMVMTLITGMVAGYLTPTAWLRWAVLKRQEQITLFLPDALDLMVVCVEAGQGLNAAMLRVGAQMRDSAPALSAELRLINHEIRAGLSRSQALRNFADRTGVDDVRALVAVLVQSDRLGSSIATALRVHADSARTRRRQRAEEQARKTAVKLVFPLVFCIFPELLVVILAPGMIQLVRTLSDTASGG